MTHWHDGGMNAAWAFWLFGGLFWLLVLGLLAFLALRYLPAGGQRAPRPQGESPLDILDRRFALGEVDLKTYQAQRAALEAALNRTSTTLQ